MINKYEVYRVEFRDSRGMIQIELVKTSSHHSAHTLANTRIKKEDGPILSTQTQVGYDKQKVVENG